MIAVSDSRKAHLHACHFDPQSDADFDQAVRDAVSYLENPKEHTDEFSALTSVLAPMLLASRIMIAQTGARGRTRGRR